MQAKDIEKNFALQQEQQQYGLTIMKFKDGRTMYGHFLMADQNLSLQLQNKWIFYFDEIKLIIHGDEIAAFNNVYTGVARTAVYA